MPKPLERLTEVSPTAARPLCLQCGQPLKPHVRILSVKLPLGIKLTPAETLDRAAAVAIGYFHFRDEQALEQVHFVSIDRPCRDSVAVRAWRRGDYLGRGYLIDRNAPAFCKDACAIEFAINAAIAGYRRGQVITSDRRVIDE